MPGTATPDGLTLWGVGTVRTIRAHWAMHELGLAYACRPVQPRSPEAYSAEYTTLTARQKVPLLQDGALTITESAAIVAYLSDAYATDANRLVPTALKQRATCLEWCFFATTELDSAALFIIRRHADMKHIYGDAPLAVTAAADYFQAQMRSVNRCLEDGRPYLLGENFSAADMILSTCTTWASIPRYGLHLGDTVLAHNARVTARPAYTAAKQVNWPEG